MLTKTQGKIMQIFVSQITEIFSIRQIERMIGMNYSLVHRAIKPLVEPEELLSENKQGFLSLDYKKNHDVISFVEYTRRNEFLKKPKNLDLSLCFTEFVEKTNDESFVLLVFGSAVNTANPADIDVLLIVDEEKKTEASELQLRNIARNYDLSGKIHITCISYKSVYEMLLQRDQKNVINEVLNKHLIIHGAELFYRLLVRGRK